MWEKIKYYLGYAFGAIVAIGAAIIFALSKKNNALKSKLGQMQADEDIRAIVMKKDDAEKEAEDAEKAYRAARDSFIREHGSSGDGAE